MYTHRLSKGEMVAAGGEVPKIQFGNKLPPRLAAIMHSAQLTMDEEAAKAAKASLAAAGGANESNAATAFYSVPLIKLLVRGTLHLVLLCSYAFVLFNVQTWDELQTREHAAAPTQPRL